MTFQSLEDLLKILVHTQREVYLVDSGHMSDCHMPALQCLFFMAIDPKVEHLKAVTRLSEEMRDREVREEALRMGVTVVEWAILLDKVGML